MPKSQLSLKATVTKRQAAEPVPSDMAERLEQLRHHQAVTAASTGTEPAQSPDPDKAHQAANDARTAVQTEPAVPKPRPDSNALQAAFLGGNLGKPVTVFTINGVRLSGKLAQFDQYCLLLENGNEQLLVFKHAISTIIPTSR